MTDVEEVGYAAGQKRAGPAPEEGASRILPVLFHPDFTFVFASPKEAEEGGESVGEAAHPLHDLGDDDLVTVRARQLHGILAQELHGDDEAAARAAVAPKAAAAASTRI